ncbi:MAG: hypothetical protein P8M17_10705 [Saprospiraceae bacterium]|jgi:hypothetical protein|nr:hypothetical protein [Saprospiraceae bacterium]MDB4539151.1 hypothetical protein [Saprospiraceae bacterium]MDC3210435.1 hypothetical protein [Saprospiraceae bacterium]MDG1432392.1 hypothetical protein [Saprospiraceae bacterium]MDG2419452.1 hypothetical protein [Saprospiraceae bacterium]
MNYINFLSILFFTFIISSCELGTNSTGKLDTGDSNNPTLISSAEIEKLDNWICVPGNQVGRIKADFNGADIYKTFGEENVLTTEIGLGEGETKRGLLVFPKTKNEIQVLFQGKVEMAKLESIRIKGIGSKWKTDSGIKVGTTIEELVAINGKDFKFYGLEWDYSGRLVSWNGGKLDKKVSIFLEATNVEPVFPDLIGDKEFWSSNPKAIEAGLFVNSILIFF